VLTSPLARSVRTCELRYGDQAQLDPNLKEWIMERTKQDHEQIQALHPEWFLFRDGVEAGKRSTSGGAALDVIDRAIRVNGDVALFAHGHILRISRRAGWACRRRMARCS